MKAIRTHQDDDLRGMTILEDGRTILYRNEGGSDVVTLIPDDEGNFEEITVVDDTAADPVNDFLHTCAETGEWGEHHDMTPEMILMYDTIKDNAHAIAIAARKKRD